MSEATLSGQFSGGWAGFYSKPSNTDAGGAPHLRTYEGRQAEKFYETFKQPAPAQRRGLMSLIVSALLCAALLGSVLHVLSVRRRGGMSMPYPISSLATLARGVLVCYPGARA